jgi:hypothetical protein
MPMRTVIAVSCLSLSLACGGAGQTTPRASGDAQDAAVGATAPAQAPMEALGTAAPDPGNSMTLVVPTSPTPSTAAAAPANPMPTGICAGVDEVAMGVPPSADIIIAVDTTSSMTEETKFVQTQLNAFSQRIVDAKVDARLILICQKPGAFVQNPICVPPPLAGPNCGDAEPRFKHLDVFVGNNDAWEQIIAAYPDYKHLLRPTSQKHIVVISDDSPGLPRASFDQMLKRLDPQFDGYKFDAIYPFTFPGKAETGICNPPNDPCCGFSDGDGSEYGRLSDDTQGVKGNLCLQDFEKVWAELAKNVSDNAQLACDWEIPEPPSGETLDPMRVNVHYSGEGVAPKLLGWVQSAGDCGANEGWYYDDNQKPTRVLACPQSCSTLKQLTHARIDIKFGCNRCSGLDVSCGGEPPPAPPELK